MTKHKSIITILLTILLSIIIISCSDKKEGNKASNNSPEADLLEVKGSDTMVNIAQILAERYTKENPNVKIAVTGGGSGTGIAALINGKCSIANSSRDIKDKEVQDAKANKVEPVCVYIGIDAISIILNPSNKISKFSMEFLEKIFKGEVTNWKEIGGDDLPITLYGRQSNSGTYVFFQEHVLKNKDYSQNMKKMNGNAQILEAIKTDKAGIGYIGLGYVKNASGIKIADVSKNSESAFISPLDIEAVKNASYSLSRPLQQYINGKPKGKIRDFLSYILSDKGQKIIEEEGFISIGTKQKDLNKEAGF